MRTRWNFLFDIDAPVAPTDLVGPRELITGKFAPIRNAVTRACLNEHIKAGKLQEPGSYVVRVATTRRGFISSLSKV